LNSSCARRRTLDEARCDRGADRDKDQAAEKFPALAGLGADLGGEVRQAEGEGDQDQSEYQFSLGSSRGTLVHYWGHLPSVCQ
jgi:hypothetical protein